MKNESEREVNKENALLGTKVVINPESEFSGQNRGSVYGIIRTLYDDQDEWFGLIDWIDGKGQIHSSLNYRYEDLLLYEYPYNIEEIEDNLNKLINKLK